MSESCAGCGSCSLRLRLGRKRDYEAAAKAKTSGFRITKPPVWSQLWEPEYTWIFKNFFLKKFKKSFPPPKNPNQEL